MAYDERLASRVEAILSGTPNFSAKKMFGGMGYLINGNMALGVMMDHIIVRVGPDNQAMELRQPHTEDKGLGGRKMNGWIHVLPEGYASEDSLRSWVQKSLKATEVLPPK